MRKITYILLFLFFGALISISGKTATLGFHGPNKMINPGEVFDVSVVAYFEEDEVDFWEHSPLLDATIIWPDTVYALECDWNTTAWEFDSANTFFNQTTTSAFFWARATAKSGAINPGAELVIATLKCVGLEYEDDAFIYDTFTNYYGVCNGAYSYSTNSSVIYTNTPSSMVYEGEDVLGDSDVEDDGFDEFPILITEEPGYTLTIIPELREIPFARKTTGIDVVIDGAESLPGYDHVRAVIDFDSSVLSNVSVEILPDFFSAVTATAIVGNVVECFTNENGNVFCSTSLVEHIVVEAYCETTNFGGVFAKFKMIPIDIDETYLEFVTEETVIEKFGVVDLLGAADDEDDGVFDAELNIRYADGLCVTFEPTESIGIINSLCESKVVLRKFTDSDIVLDEINLEALFNGLLIESNSVRFIPSAQIENENFYFDIFPNTVYDYSDYLSNNVRHADCDAELCVMWDEAPFVMKSNEVVLGTISYVPQMEGKAGFVYGYGTVEYSGADFSDVNAWAENWPAVIPVVSENDSKNQLFAGIEFDTNIYYSIKPASEISLSVFVYGSASNVNYNLNWFYDPTTIELLPGSEGVSLLCCTNESDLSVLHISGNAIDLPFATNKLATLKFKALRSGDAALMPVTPEKSTNFFCAITDSNSNDLLGSSSVLGDGAAEFQLIIQEAEDVYLTFKPSAMLYAGLATNVILSVNNPLNSEWDEISAAIEFDTDEIVLVTNKWEILLDDNLIKSVEENWIKTVAEPTGFTNSYGEQITNYSTVAKIHIFTKIAITNSKNIAAIKMFALEDEPYWCFNIGTGLYDYAYTRVTYNGVLKINDDRIEESDWNVYPNGVGIWLSGSQAPPVLGTNYTLTATVGNPHNFNISHVNLCWSFDSAQLEIDSIKFINGFSTNFDGGGLWINNNNDGDGYICAKLIADTQTKSDFVQPLELSIIPKLNEIIEIYPDDDVFYDDTDISMGVWSTFGINENYNLVEMLSQDYSDVCPEWRRGVVWFPIPQLVFDDIYLDVNETYIIEDLNDPTEGLANGSQNKKYLWWTEGNKHITFSFNQALNSATIMPEHDWVGEEIIDIFCREVGSPFVGRTKLRIVVGEDEMDFNIVVDRDEYLTITSHLFDEATFNVLNETNPVLISAWFIGADKTTNHIDVIDPQTDEIITNARCWTQGKLKFQTLPAPGIFTCYIQGKVIRKHDYSPPTANASFYLETQNPYEDSDGDRFIILYNRRAIAPGKRSVNISGGNNKDQLKIKLIAKRGDGLIKLDNITSDAGFKSIYIPGSVNLIDTKGPIKKLRVDRGAVGLIKVARGGIHSVVINNPFHKKEEDYMEAGLIKGIICDGSIDSLVVKGGDIGIDDEPATIKVTRGSVKRIIATLNVKTKIDPGFGKDIYSFGGNIFANISADRNIGEILAVGGSIGTDFDDAVSSISAEGSIKKIKAMSKKGDYEVLGGYIHSNISAGKSIKEICAIGGDILGTTEIYPEDVGDEALDYRINISAKSIKNLKCFYKNNLFKDGPNPVDDWYFEFYGGSIGADINLTGSSLEPAALKKISAKGGSLCVYINANGNIGNINVKSVKCREYLDDEFELRGGDIFNSAFLPKVVYKSSAPSDYKGIINKLDIAGRLFDTWIGLKGPYNPKKIKLSRAQLSNSEVWVDARPYLTSN